MTLENITSESIFQLLGVAEHIVDTRPFMARPYLDHVYEAWIHFLGQNMVPQVVNKETQIVDLHFADTPEHRKLAAESEQIYARLRRGYILCMPDIVQTKRYS